MMMSPDVSKNSASMHKVEIEQHLKSLINVYDHPDNKHNVDNDLTPGANQRSLFNINSNVFYKNNQMSS